jgi:S1-C subfamily serine protease
MAIAGQIAGGLSSAGLVFGSPAFLGIQPSNRSVPGGVDIVAVVPDTPASGAGLAGGDLLTSIGGAPVTSVNSLTQVLGGHHPGDVVTITWTNASGEHSATVTLIAGPAV